MNILPAPTPVSPLTRIVRLRRGESLNAKSVRDIVGDEQDALKASQKYQAHLEAQGDFIESGHSNERALDPYFFVVRNCGDNCVKFYYTPSRSRRAL
jgi:hypothetical protein